MINILYYSKNRPMQLEASLRSLKTTFKEYDQSNIGVIFDASNANFLKSYRSLLKEYPEVNFLFQNNIKKETIDFLDTKNWLSMFIMDDIFFKDNFSLGDSVFKQMSGNRDLLGVSLRLSKEIKYCYALDNFMKQPEFIRNTDEFCVWKYPGCEGDWGYAYSLDGNVYQTDFIKALISKLTFDNPNLLEAGLNQLNIGPQYVACYAKSKLFNAPMNRVQNTFENRHENRWNPEKLNTMFQEGKRLKLENVFKVQNDAVHFPIEFEFQQ